MVERINNDWLAPKPDHYSQSIFILNCLAQIRIVLLVPIIAPWPKSLGFRAAT